MGKQGSKIKRKQSSKQPEKQRKAPVDHSATAKLAAKLDSRVIGTVCGVDTGAIKRNHMDSIGPEEILSQAELCVQIINQVSLAKFANDSLDKLRALLRESERSQGETRNAWGMCVSNYFHQMIRGMDLSLTIAHHEAFTPSSWQADLGLYERLPEAIHDAQRRELRSELVALVPEPDRKKAEEMVARLQA